LAVDFSKHASSINSALEVLSKESGLQSGISVALSVLNLLGDFEGLSNDEIIDAGVLKLPNAERQDPWFNPHPWMRDERAAFEIIDSPSVPIQAKFYWQKRRGKANIAGSVHFTKNWEDFDFTRTEDLKIGIDFFLAPAADSVLVVLSNRGKLRVLELSGRLTNTQREIFDKWFGVREDTSRELLHEALWESFQLQSVTSKFYLGVAESFDQLSTHLRAIGRDAEESKLFASRLLGRLIFVWFVRKMGLISFTPEYFDAFEEDEGLYYRLKLERLFFRTLNTTIDERGAESDGTIDLETPYLNGGLFSPRDGDWVNDETLTFPSGYFRHLFTHFDEFNFTTDESTPDYEQIAIDPEMLGRVFESLLASQIELTGEQARKAKGAFYTPREIVAFMCKEAVRTYLEDAIPDDARFPASVSKLLDTSDQDWAIAGSNSIRDIPDEIRSVLAKRLQEIKTLDPACGSGAFPLGMLQLLSRLQLRLDPRLDEYTLKLSILRDNIFGVDIEPMAVEISRLRSWLSLILEKKDQKNVDPLPNLEFNFVAANSLLSLEEENQLSVDPSLHSRLADLRTAYFAATTPKRKRQIQRDYALLTTDDIFDGFDVRARILKTFDPFDSEGVAEFFDPEIMFGVDDGFGVVIGNPPYIGLKGHADLFAAVRNSSLGRRFFSGKMDYFYFFYHLGLDLLREGGALSLVTTNYFLTATYADKLVADIGSRSSVVRMLNFGNIKIFESALGQHNLITVLQKGYRKQPACVQTAIGGVRGKRNNSFLDSFLAGDAEATVIRTISQDSIVRNGRFNFESDSDPMSAALSIMASSSETLGDRFNINQGIVSGGDKVSKGHVSRLGWPDTWVRKGIFVLTPEELAALDLDAHEKEIVKPWFKNSDVRRYVTENTPRLHVVYAVAKQKNLETRPKLREHIMQFYGAFKNQRDCAAPYLNLPRAIDFDGPKIVAPQRSSRNTFAWNECAWFSSADVYFITSKGSGGIDLVPLLGLLNSNLYFAWLYNRGKRKGPLLELYAAPLSEIPLPESKAFSSVQWMGISELVAKLIEDPSREGKLQPKIDNLVCELFGFNQSQKDAISSWAPES